MVGFLKEYPFLFADVMSLLAPECQFPDIVYSDLFIENSYFCDFAWFSNTKNKIEIVFVWLIQPLIPINSRGEYEKDLVEVPLVMGKIIKWRKACEVHSSLSRFDCKYIILGGTGEIPNGGYYTIDNIRVFPIENICRMIGYSTNINTINEIVLANGDAFWKNLPPNEYPL